jgi:hypothetical protein
MAKLHDLLEIPEVSTVTQKLKEKITENPTLSDPTVYKKVVEIIRYSKKVYDEFIKGETTSSDVLKAVLLLAQVDVIYRAGLVDENLGNVDEKDMKDLKNLISLVKPEYFKAKKICLLNPTFGKASQLVGGADCDLVIGDTIIDIKTTKKLELTRNYFDQLMGYYILYKIETIDGMLSNCEIKRLGIYFSRYAYLHFIDVQDVIREDTFPTFVEWFKKRAGEEYGLIYNPTEPPNSAVLRTLPLSGSLNRWICSSLTLAQICPYGQTSHIPRTLSEIRHKRCKK